jgi:hemolysin III
MPTTPDDGQTTAIPASPSPHWLDPARKPRLRGVSHQWAFVVSLVTGLVLVLIARHGTPLTAAVIYAVSVTALFGTSAVYHRTDWRTLSARRWMRRLDHSMIFVLIAGTYTPFALVALHGTLATVILIVVWSGALAGVVLQLLWVDAPRLVTAGVYIAIGWVALASFPQMVDRVGITGTALVAVGGALYSAGAVIYALKRPDPAPAVFGYHEIFHALVIVAAALHYAVVALIVLPGAA